MTAHAAAALLWCCLLYGSARFLQISERSMSAYTTPASTIGEAWGAGSHQNSFPRGPLDGTCQLYKESGCAVVRGCDVCQWGSTLGHIARRPGAIPSEMLVVEVGALDGRDAREAAEHGFRVVSFEPSPTNYKDCLKNAPKDQYPRVTFVNAAASDTDGTVDFLDDGASGSCVQCTDGVEPSSKRVQVKAVKLDTYFSKQTEPIELLKIDVQGYEPQVFSGMAELIRRGLVKRLMFEYDPCLMKGSGASYSDMIGAWYRLQLRAACDAVCVVRNSFDAPR